MSSPVTPAPAESSEIVYRFGLFELHSGNGELRRNGHLQRLPEQPLLILLALLERPGEIVSRETLHERLWPENTYVDFELGLNAAIKRLRRALFDDAVNPRFIETLPKRGYRLIVPVTVDMPDAIAAAPPAATEQSKNEVAQDAEPLVERGLLRWLPWGLAGAGFLGIAILVSLPFFKAKSTRPPRRYSILLPESAGLAPASFMPLGVGRPNLAISRNGDQIVYTGVVGQTTQLFLRDNSGMPPRPLTGTEGAHSPFFSPDGQWIGFFAENKLKKIRLDGGPAIALCDVALGFGGFWAEDDSIYFTPGERTAIYRIAALGGVPAQVTTHPGTPSERTSLEAMYWPQLLPGGKGILFGRSRSGIGVFDTVSRTSKVLTLSGSSPRWSATGHILYVDNGILWALPFDAKSLEKKGPPVVVLDHVRMELQGAAQYDIAQEGTLNYASGGDVAEASFVWLDAHGKEQDVGLSPQRFGEFRLSPDGRTLALVIHSATQDDLWAFDLERRVLLRLTGEGWVWSPIWTPDGRKIVYSSNSSAKSHVIELTLDGLQKRVIAFVPGLFQLNGFAPGGQMISISRRDGADAVLCLMDATTGQLHELVRSSYMLAFPTISPDGHWLAYVSDETGRWEVYVRAIDKGSQTWRITTAGGEEPIWDRSGRRLYLRNGAKWMRVDIASGPVFKASEPMQVVRGPYVNIPGYSYDIAGDGRFLLLKAEDQDRRSTQLEVVENWPALLSKSSHNKSVIAEPLR